MKTIKWWIVAGLWVMWLLPAQAQKFSNKPEEFIGQFDNLLRGSGQAQVAESFRQAWNSGTFNSNQQTQIITISQKMTNQRLRANVELKELAESLIYLAANNSAQLSNFLNITQKVFEKYKGNQMSLYVSRIRGLVVKKALYDSNFNKILADGSFEFVYIQGESDKKGGWFNGWSEADSEPDSLGNIRAYPHPVIEGPCILFGSTNLIFQTPQDSVSIANTKIAYIFEKDGLVGQGGAFDWANLYTDADSLSLAQNKRPIKATFTRYSHAPLKDVRFKAENVTLTYPGKLKGKSVGRFNYVAEKHKSKSDLRYPQFYSYDAVSLENIGKNITFAGGMAVKAFKLYGEPAKGFKRCYLTVSFQGNKQFEARAREIYLGEDRLESPSVSFAYYLAAGDSITHMDVALSYDVVKQKRDTTPINVFKLIKNKQNNEIPFIDNYHKIYITADLAIYNPEKGSMDFYILGANNKIPARFESFSYFNEERYDALQGSYNFHPLKMIESASNQYGVTNAQGNKSFNIAGVGGDQVKGVVRNLARQGYIVFDEDSGEITVLNRTSHNDASSNYVRVVRTMEKGKRVGSLKAFADHDYDDMLIESISPREAKKDVINQDTVPFKFDRSRMLLAKIENKDIYITRRVFVSKSDTLASARDSLRVSRDTTVIYKDTLKIDGFLIEKQATFFIDLDKAGLKPERFILTELEGFFLVGKRIKGPVMPNATIDAVGGAITIRGIEKFTISKKLNVNIIPRYKEIKIFGDRVIVLEDGEVTVGNYRFIGRNFTLPYDEFKLTMETIDSVLFTIRDQQDTSRRIELGSEIRMNAGDLYINNPNNKSGLKRGFIPGSDKDSYEAYPKLLVETGGKIYFDQFYRQRGAYHREQAYFDIPNIDIDSLTSHRPKFEGIFYSNIFEPIKESLVPVYDPNYNGIESKYSLGFVHRPKKAYKIYGTEAVLKTDSLVMYKTALHAKGKNDIQHLTTTLKGDLLTFTPDSLVARNILVEVKQGKAQKGYFPRVSPALGKLKWYTQQVIEKDTVPLDSMTVETTRELFHFFEEGKQLPASLKGTMAITPNGMWAAGFFARKDFSIFAPEALRISPERIWTPDRRDNIVEFRINSQDFDPFAKDITFLYDQYKPVIQGNAVDVDLDIVKGKATMTPNQSILEADPQYAFITFPFAQFKTSIKEATWDVIKKEVVMAGDSNSVFISTKYEEEGEAEKDIEFKATAGVYDLVDLSQPKLELSGVPYIISADARIIPDKNEIVILKGADVQELTKAKLIIDTLNGYHNLIDGNIKINHKLSFDGNATYRYVNIDRDTTKIKFERFELADENKVSSVRRKDTTYTRTIYTKASGEVREADKFFITSRVQFKGTVTMLAPKKDLLLDGFIKLDLKNRENSDSWIPYNRDAGDVFIELDERTTVGVDVLTSGLHYVPYEGKLYTTFLANKQAAIDVNMFLAKGVLTYNPTINEFKIAELEKSAGKSYAGRLIMFDDAQGEVRMEGKMTLVDELTQKYIETSALAKVKLTLNDYNINTFMIFDFPGPKPVFTAMGEILSLNKPEDALPANPIALDLYYKMAEFVGNEKTKEYETNSSLGYVPLSLVDKSLVKPLVISNVNLKWSDTANAFYSIGKIGVSHIFGKDINASLNGYLEIKKIIDGDQINLYLEGANDTWFYLSFSNGVLSGVSSSDKFNAGFGKGKIPKKVGDFGYELLEEFAATQFKERFVNIYQLMKFEGIQKQENSPLPDAGLQKTDPTPTEEQKTKEEEAKPEENKTEKTKKTSEPKSKKKKKKKGEDDQEEPLEEEAPTEKKKDKEDGF